MMSWYVGACSLGLGVQSYAHLDRHIKETIRYLTERSFKQLHSGGKTTP